MYTNARKEKVTMIDKILCEIFLLKPVSVGWKQTFYVNLKEIEKATTASFQILDAGKRQWPNERKTKKEMNGSGLCDIITQVIVMMKTAHRASIREAAIGSRRGMNLVRSE